MCVCHQNQLPWQHGAATPSEVVLVGLRSDVHLLHQLHNVHCLASSFLERLLCVVEIAIFSVEFWVFQNSLVWCEGVRVCVCGCEGVCVRVLSERERESVCLRERERAHRSLCGGQ